MKILGTLLVVVVFALIGGVAWLGLADVPVSQTTVTQDIPVTVNP
jgi:hypothetical protein